MKVDAQMKRRNYACRGLCNICWLYAWVAWRYVLPDLHAQLTHDLSTPELCAFSYPVIFYGQRYVHNVLHTCHNACHYPVCFRVRSANGCMTCKSALRNAHTTLSQTWTSVQVAGSILSTLKLFQLRLYMLTSFVYVYVCWEPCVPLALVLLNCLWVCFIHLKLELLTQYPASNEWNILLFMQNVHLPSWIIWLTKHLPQHVRNFSGILFSLKFASKRIIYTVLPSKHKTFL